MIYFNSNSTSYPKPSNVIDAVSKNLVDLPFNVNRGGSFGGSVVGVCRIKIAEFFNASDPSSVVFTSGSTEALNLLIFGLDNPKEIITTTTEHTSVLRPLKTLERDLKLKIEFVNCDATGFVNPDDIADKITLNTSAIIVNHCSNVTGAIQDIKTISKIAKQRNIPLIVDASQSAGAVPIDLRSTPVDALVFTGHKSMMGITGIGGLILNPNLKLKPLKVGGTGSKSNYLFQPEGLPVHYEAGTLNYVGISSIVAGIDYIEQMGFDRMYEMKKKIYDFIYKELSQNLFVLLFGVASLTNRLPVINFKIKGIDNSDLVYILSESYNIFVRAGLHCAPLIHESIGSSPLGTVRVSFSHLNTLDEAEIFIRAINQIVRAEFKDIVIPR